MAAMGASRATRADDSAWAMAVGANSNDENEMPADVDSPVVSHNGTDSPPSATTNRQPLATSPNSRPAQRVRSRKSSKQLKEVDENGFPIYNIPRKTSWEKIEDAELAGKGKNNRGVSTDRLKRKSSRGAVSTLDEVTEHEKWIHRDKLMQIESKELAEIGQRLVSSMNSRAPSRARSQRTGKSSVDVTDHQQRQQENQDPLPTEEFHDAPTTMPNKKIRTKSPSPGEFSQQAAEHQRIDSFADAVSQRSTGETSSRPGTSSRLPVAAQDLPYESPESQRTGPEHMRSGSRELLKQKQRLRSQSGARELASDTTSETASAKSPQKRTASKTRTASTTRKASGVNGRKNSSSSSGTSPNRPSTSGGRPKTRNGPPNPVNRPEGDPPWLDQMYKPDPRLPPDQQMLPTHARRMAELQREAEERARQEANRKSTQEDFVLMDSEEENQKHGSTGNGSDDGERRDPRRDSKRESGQWPLRTPTPQGQAERLHHTAGHESPPMIDANFSHRRNGTIDSVAAAGQQGYSLTPTVRSQEEQQKKLEQQQLRMSQRSRLSQTTVGIVNGHARQLSDQEWKVNAAQAPVHQPVRLSSEPEKTVKAEKKGCLACCTVM